MPSHPPDKFVLTPVAYFHVACLSCAQGCSSNSFLPDTDLGLIAVFSLHFYLYGSVIWIGTYLGKQSSVYFTLFSFGLWLKNGHILGPHYCDVGRSLRRTLTLQGPTRLHCSKPHCRTQLL